MAFFNKMKLLLGCIHSFNLLILLHFIFKPVSSLKLHPKNCIWMVKVSIRLSFFLYVVLVVSASLFELKNGFSIQFFITIIIKKIDKCLHKSSLNVVHPTRKTCLVIPFTIRIIIIKKRREIQGEISHANHQFSYQSVM